MHINLQNAYAAICLLKWLTGFSSNLIKLIGSLSTDCIWRKQNLRVKYVTLLWHVHPPLSSRTSLVIFRIVHLFIKSPFILPVSSYCSARSFSLYLMLIWFQFCFWYSYICLIDEAFKIPTGVSVLFSLVKWFTYSQFRILLWYYQPKNRTFSL